MGSNFRVALNGTGRVFDLLSEIISNSQYPLEVVNSDADNKDVWVDCNPDASDVDLVLDTLKSKVPVVLCSKNLVSDSKNTLVDTAKENKNKLYLNSLFSSYEKNKYSFMNINEKTIKTLEDKEYLEMETNDEAIAKYLYQDIIRAFNRWDPDYEQRRIGEINRKREAAKENLYSIAKSLDVEVESQPCGIDPKLPDNVEVKNVSNGN
jgi:hypothetical protein